MTYLPYKEPGIIVILSLASFLLLLNGVRYILDRLLYCGIIGEILIGMIWGLPVGGTSWLSLDLQESIQALGYLGLVGLVFEGGLETDMALLRKNALISVSIATVGLLAPIALSFLLTLFPFSTAEGTAYPTPLAAFSAGASLCSTSLGTTFAILSSAKLQKTRVGVVLVGAAMMDDVVGLVMVNIVTTLGSGGAGGWPIARPIVASFSFLLVVLIGAPFVLKRPYISLGQHLHAMEHGDTTQTGNLAGLQSQAVSFIKTLPSLGFIIRTLTLIVFVTIASYIDASVLFASFMAGGLVHYLSNSITSENSTTASDSNLNNPLQVVDLLHTVDPIHLLLEYMLLPFFFASIGFSIPLTEMFTGSLVWKGIVYTVLMILGKGLVTTVIYGEHLRHVWHRKKPALVQITLRNRARPVTAPIEQSEWPHSSALLVGFAMVTRGEIGFLIASLSQSSGTLTLKARAQSDTESSGEAVFLVIVWAAVLCTIIGPIAVGIIVRKLKEKENNPLMRW